MRGKSRTTAETEKPKPAARDRGPNGGPRAMSRVLDLFATLAQNRNGMTLTELSGALDVPKSTFLNSLRALVSDGFLINHGNEYRLGPSAYRLASAIMASASTDEIVRYYVRDLAAATKESVGYAIPDWDIGQIIYIEGISSPKPVHYAMRTGIRAPLYVSAAGRVILAYSPVDQREDYLARAHIRPLTRLTRTDPETLRAHLEEIRANGYCASFGEMLEDTAAIAAPIFDASGELSGALMVAAPIDRMRASYEFLLSTLVETARKASGLSGEFAARLGAVSPGGAAH